MIVKTDTKERFHVITLPGPSLPATMTDELGECLLPYLQNDVSEPEKKVKNLVVNLEAIGSIELRAAEKLEV